MTEAAPKRGMLEWLRHAFAVDSFDEASLEPEEREALDKLAAQIHSRRMTSAAILWLHSNRHLGWLGSQALVTAAPVYDLAHVFVAPLLRTLGVYVPPAEMPPLIAAFEKRYGVEYLVQQLEAAQAGE